ncbi:hypothetical protein [Nannocystis sp. SCPEA4]|uniref:hypothetical protein n=1 Tax=Nannocystis sp. SCPEA4 TaxID=2996787 RepID=UPI00226D4E78|nr:hypothetical protein [Nannocystis sp. SCPEA4]MCY1054250.1 hypothetical protein [Nannocystis sp. SCPEA4]
MAGGRAAGAAAVVGLVLAGCWKENPAFFVTEGPDTDTDTGEATTLASSSAAIVPESTTMTSTTDEATTAVDPSQATTTATTTGVATSGHDPTTTTATTTSITTTGEFTGSSGTTAEDVAPTCGSTGYGPAELLARRWNGVVPQACGEISGGNFLIVGGENGMVAALACATAPAAGCSNCEFGKSLQFAFHTPEPAEDIDVGPCVYLAAHGAMAGEPLGPCRYQQMALWHDGSNTPGKGPPLALFGHQTLSPDPAVSTVAQATLGVEPVLSESECSCIDLNDCCPEKAVEYSLRFVGAEAVEVAPGQHATLEFADAVYEAYNGQSFETGACGQEQRFDWWLLRQP